MSHLTPATRRHILEDMGIDVWRARLASGESAGAAGRAAPEPTAAVDAKPDPVAPARRAAPRVRSQPDADVRSQPDADVRSQPADRRQPGGAAGEAAQAPVTSVPRPDGAATAASVSVLSMAVPGVVLLFEGDLSKRDQRLALDVLAAASGDWQAKPALRRFEWAPTASLGGGSTDARARGGAEAMQRGLEAFVDKDLDDHHGRLLLCSGALAERLPERWAHCQRVILPPFDRLGRDAALKRALWQSLQQALLAAPQAPAKPAG